MAESMIAPEQKPIFPAEAISRQQDELKSRAASDLRALTRQFREGDYPGMKKTAAALSMCAAQLEALEGISKTISPQPARAAKQSDNGGKGGFLSSLRIEKKA